MRFRKGRWFFVSANSYFFFKGMRNYRKTLKLIIPVNSAMCCQVFFVRLVEKLRVCFWQVHHHYSALLGAGYCSVLDHTGLMYFKTKAND